MRRHMTTEPASKNKNQQTTSAAANVQAEALMSDGGNPLQRSDSLASASNPQAAKSTKTAPNSRKEESALHADPSTPVPNGSSPSVPDAVSLTSVPDTASPTWADETASLTSPDKTDHVNCDDASKRKEQSVEHTETLSKTSERIILQKHSDSSIKNYGNLDICRSNSGSQANPSMGSMSNRGAKQTGRYGRLRQALLTTSVTLIQGDDPSGPTATCVAKAGITTPPTHGHYLDRTGADDDTTASTGISGQNSDAVSLQDLTPGAMSKSITFDHSVYIKTVPRYGPLAQRTKLHKKPPLPANSMIPVDEIRMNHEGSNSFSSDIVEDYLKDVKKRHIHPTHTIHSAESVAAGVTTKNDDDAHSEINAASQSQE